MPRFLSLFAATLMIAGCDRGGAPADPQPRAEAPVQGLDRSRAGSPMPSVLASDDDGEPADLAGAGPGKPLLVNLWATWCAPCVKELPTLDALSARPGAPRILALSQDMAPRGSVDAFIAGKGLGELEVWHDPDMAFSDRAGAQILPTTILYDRQGREVWRYVGDLDWTGDQAARWIAEAS